MAGRVPDAARFSGDVPVIFDKYMAVPFVENGRSFAGADCFGFYALILAHELGIAVPDPDVSFTRDGARAVLAAFAAGVARGEWIAVETPRMFDAVRMTGVHVLRGKAGKSESHIGCYDGHGRVIHTELNTGPRCMALDDPEIAPRFRGFFRPAVLMNVAIAA